VGVESARVHRCLADALVLLDEVETAEAELERGLEIDPESHECWHELGVISDGRGDFEKAVVAFGRAVELAPQRIAYHQRLGFALESIGRRKDAIESFKAALKLESDDKRGR